jgi:hypothetical protein
MRTAVVSRYHLLLVTLHWLLAVLIIAISRPADATTGYPRLDRLAPIDLAWDCRVCWDEAENVLDGEGFWGQDRIELLADALKSGRAPHRSQA